jgi:hypothetical protein
MKGIGRSAVMEKGGAAGVPMDLSVFIPYFKNLSERNGYPFIGTA